MNFQALLHSFRGRAPWRSVISPYLKSLGFHVGRGIDASIGDIVSQGYAQDQVAAIRGMLVENLVAGEKSLRVFKVGQRDMPRLRNWAQNKRAVQNPLTAAFPGIASSSNVRAHVDGVLHYVGPLTFDGGVAAVFTSVRSYLERVPLGADSLRPSVTDTYEKIYGQKRHFVQTYDAIYVPARGRYVYLLADYPANTPSDFFVNSQSGLELFLRRNVDDHEILSLWPVVEGLYLANDGSFVEHGFQTDGDSVKNHKSRRGSKDLRQDDFFKAGREKIEQDGKDLVSYRIATRWAVRHSASLTTHPELMLPGTVGMWTKGEPLEDAVIRGCLGMRDLDFVLSKISSHL